MGRGWVDAVHPDDAAEVVAFLDRSRGTAMRVTKEFRVLRPDGEVRHLRVVAAPKAGEPDSGHVMTVEDITEEVEAQQALAHQAFYDTLTGLAEPGPVPGPPGPGTGTEPAATARPSPSCSWISTGSRS